ncbi:ferredoxin [Chloroherpeton thalassium ATCC 35110]|uniref:Ferredoxin n=1 Tax=Chloroherpeton thalassium (strain ATCC 35110 / GB-78) TaxID=517418 RepID=B3QXB9_CHLT3|nr:2Fe-2S iron-sulfur cluster-binding protein [Chloroherpeton thalassium]ACF13393.1 ferredoxin [Chloroherpeton thalassium ATCC 35110]
MLNSLSRLLIPVTIEGHTMFVPEGTNLLTAARSLGIELCSACYGHGLCAACLVKILKGAENLSPMEKEEYLALALRGFQKELQEKKFPELRLSCQTFVYGETEAIKLN